MSVTKKFIIIVSAGILPLAVFSGSGISFAVFIIYNCVCFILLVVDFFITPKQKVFDIWRMPEDKLFFKEINTVSFYARNNYSKPLELTLKDEPSDFHFELPLIKKKRLLENLTLNHNKNTQNYSAQSQLTLDMTKTVPAHGILSFSYDTRPTKRGSFLFSNVHLKYKGVLGLCYKYAKRPLPMDFKVYPNLKDLSKYRLLMTKNMALENGKRIINVRGEGLEFESLREYIDGDDIRKINWMVSAREQKYIINVHEAEKNQPVFIMIDTGRPMSYLLKGYKKLDYAINAALILSDIVNQKGDNSGLLVFDTTLKTYIKPGKGPNHRNNLMEALYHIEDTKNTSDYYSAFRTFIMRQKRKSIVFVFTDLETDVELNDFVGQIKLLKSRHLPVVALMKNDSVIKMSENEGKDSRSIYEKSVALEYLAKRQNLIRTLNVNGIICIESDAEDFAIDSVNRYLKIKAGRNYL